MLKAALAALALAASPVFPPNFTIAPAKTHAVTPPAPAPEEHGPSAAALKAKAIALADVVSHVEKQPMHLAVLLSGLRSDGKIAEAVYQNPDASLTVGLLLGAEGDGWKMLEILRPL